MNSYYRYNKVQTSYGNPVLVIENKQAIQSYFPEGIKSQFSQIRKLGLDLYLAISFHYLETQICHKNLKNLLLINSCIQGKQLKQETSRYISHNILFYINEILLSQNCESEFILSQLAQKINHSQYENDAIKSIPQILAIDYMLKNNIYNWQQILNDKQPPNTFQLTNISKALNVEINIYKENLGSLLIQKYNTSHNYCLKFYFKDQYYALYLPLLSLKQESSISEEQQLQKQVCSICNKKFENSSELYINSFCYHQYCIKCIQANSQLQKCLSKNCSSTLFKGITFEQFINANNQESLNQAKNIKQIKCQQEIECAVCGKTGIMQIWENQSLEYYKCEYCRKITCLKHTIPMKLCQCLCEICLEENKAVNVGNITYQECDNCKKQICLNCLNDRKDCKCQPELQNQQTEQTLELPAEEDKEQQKIEVKEQSETNKHKLDQLKIQQQDEIELKIKFCNNENEIIEKKDKDEEIQINYLRVTGAETIVFFNKLNLKKEQVNNFAAKSNYQEAYTLLENKINEIKDSKFAKQDLLVMLLQDLEQAKQINYQQFGQEMMMQNIQNVHLQQQSAQVVECGTMQKQIYSKKSLKHFNQK